ncbi:MAG: DUF1800 family protein [Candidatus Binatia bacterium]
MAVWNYENAAHLLKRAAFGGTPEAIEAFLASYDSVEDAVDDIVNFSVSKKKPPKGGRDWWQAERKQKAWWLKTMLKTRSPKDALREKMVLFWHNHLCSGTDKVRDTAYTMAYMPIQNGLFRRYANGNFRDLVRDFNRDPANLYYLDGILNRASYDFEHVHVNENFGREVLELFTTGISQLAADGTDDPTKPCYTEDDVHQLARALTGWVHVEKDVGIWQEWAWDGGQYDDGGGTHHPGDPITIFGVTNNNFKIGFPGDGVVEGTADDVLDHVLSQLDDDGNHQAAMYVCRKLWTWFAYPAPAPDLKALLEGFAAIFVASNYEVAPVLAAMFKHDEFYSARAKTRTVKNPVDFMVGAFRALGVKSNGKPVGSSNNELFDLLDEMGMELFEPPNVAGWPGGKRWITTGTLVARLEFARRLAESDHGSSNLRLETIVPMGSADTDPNVVLDAILVRLGLDDVGGGVGSQGGVALTATQRAAMLNFITDQGTETGLDLSTSDTSHARHLVRGAISLALQAAEAQVF